MATFSTRRVSVVVSNIVGNAAQIRVASEWPVSSARRAPPSVILAASRRSSTTAGTGTMKTNRAPTKVIGKTTPVRRDKPETWGLRVAEDIRSTPQYNQVSTQVETKGECRHTLRLMRESRGESPAIFFRGERRMCGRTIPPASLVRVQRPNVGRSSFKIAAKSL